MSRRTMTMLCTIKAYCVVFVVVLTIQKNTWWQCYVRLRLSALFLLYKCIHIFYFYDYITSVFMLNRQFVSVIRSDFFLMKTIRWHNHLNPHIKKDAWTLEEELTLLNAHRVNGNKWAELAKLLPGRYNSSANLQREKAGIIKNFALVLAPCFSAFNPVTQTIKILEAFSFIMFLTCSRILCMSLVPCFVYQLVWFCRGHHNKKSRETFCLGVLSR